MMKGDQMICGMKFSIRKWVTEASLPSMENQQSGFLIKLHSDDYENETEYQNKSTSVKPDRYISTLFTFLNGSGILSGSSSII
jgi:hypothetical protein